MLSQKGFLLDELSNIDRSLKEALRHDYGAHKAQAFYEECTSRLEALLFSAESTLDSEIQLIAELTNQASNLSSLIGRIERSHRGEFSWSFAEEIDQLGDATCSDPTGADPSPPLFFFFSEGGISSYAIWSEQQMAAAASTRIFNVVFPRTLKNHVLLHPILGHELGHAAVSVPSKKVIADRIFNILKVGSPLSDVDQFTNWLRSIGMTLPDTVSPQIAGYWLEEFFCDIFGLLLLGPAFVGAHGTLLSVLDPGGKVAGQRHPPVRTRVRLVKIVLDELGWRTEIDAILNSVDPTLPRMWQFLDDANIDEPWVQLLKDDQIRAAVKELIRCKADFGNVFYQPCDQYIIKELALQTFESIPPVRQQDFESDDLHLHALDFRCILLAGWICWGMVEAASANNLKFVDVNRLCEQAILQQRAIHLQLEYTK